jgi:hypothetical protein
MSESEIHAVMKEQARKKQGDHWPSKFLEYSSNSKVIWNGISVADPI